MLNLKAAKEQYTKELCAQPRSPPPNTFQEPIARDAQPWDDPRDGGPAASSDGYKWPSMVATSSDVYPHPPARGHTADSRSRDDPYSLPQSSASLNMVGSARFEVGDRVEYCSDTYHQWMLGTVQRVRDGGLVYDLDVKKGAQASKLRHARPQQNMQGIVQAETLFDSMDHNQDGVISRSEFRAGLGSHLIEGGPNASFSPTSPAMSPIPPPTFGAGKALRGDRKSNSRIREHSVPLSPSGDESSLTPINPVRRGGGYPDSVARTAAAARPSTSRVQTTAIQARKLHQELVAESNDWAEAAGQDMVSRAGAVTVRKMVETTKALLQGLEGALILRAGFIAGCFHMWRCETTLSQTMRVYQDEFERHHEQWASHLEHHKKTFEQRLAEAVDEGSRSKARAAAATRLAVMKWINGDTSSLLRQVLKEWRSCSAKAQALRRNARSIHGAMLASIEGSARATLRLCVQSWQQSAQQTRELLKERAGWERRLQEMSAKMQARNKETQVVMAKWLFGAAKGFGSLFFIEWARYVKARQTNNMRKNAASCFMLNMMKQSDKGTLASIFKLWLVAAKSEFAIRRQQSEMMSEGSRLKQLLTDERKRHEEEKLELEMDRDQLRDQAKKNIFTIIDRWAIGEEAGLTKSIFRVWSEYVAQQLNLGRARQSVHIAILRFFSQSDHKALVSSTFTSWGNLTVSRLREKKYDEDKKQEIDVMTTQWEKVLLDKDEDIKEQQALKSRVVEMMLREWMGATNTDMAFIAYEEWKEHVKYVRMRKRSRQAVRGAVLRSIEGEEKGCKRMCFVGWFFTAKAQRDLRAGLTQADAQVDTLNEKIRGMLSSKAKLVKQADLVLASKDRLLFLGLVFTSWNLLRAGEGENLKDLRRQAARLEQVERRKNVLETKRKVLQAHTVALMNYKDSVADVLVVFLSWKLVMEKVKEMQVAKIRKNQLMDKYSEFVIDEKLKGDSKALRASAFAEWRREAKLLFHQRHSAEVQNAFDETRRYILDLERQKADLQEQLGLCYQQVDSITDTLQKELKTKEELTAELRSAFDKMRKMNMAPAFAHTATTAADFSSSVVRASSRLSHASSEETMDQPTTPGRRGGAAGRQYYQHRDTGDPSPRPAAGVRDLRRGGPKPQPHGSPNQSCDWDAAFERMTEEQLVTVDSPERRGRGPAPREPLAR